MRVSAISRQPLTLNFSWSCSARFAIWVRRRSEPCNRIQVHARQSKTYDDLAAGLARLAPDATVVVVTPPALAAKRQTTTIPTIMAPAADPLRAGLVASLPAGWKLSVGRDSAVDQDDPKRRPFQP
jgi:hypothetical protein